MHSQGMTEQLFSAWNAYNKEQIHTRDKLEHIELTAVMIYSVFSMRCP